MSFTKEKSTKRFSFKISRDQKSHRAGANTVTIGTNDQSGYSGITTRVTMTVKEAKAFQKFLNENIPVNS